jgi:hypothetical protein
MLSSRDVAIPEYNTSFTNHLKREALTKELNNA